VVLGIVISESCLARWLAIADRVDTRASGRREADPAPGDPDEVRELRRLEQVAVRA